MKCKHCNGGLLAFYADHNSSVGLATTGRLGWRCVACDECASLGPAVIDERVEIEISAAEIAQGWKDQNYKPGCDRFDWCPSNKSDEMCAICEGVFLARCIVEHDEGEL